MPIKVTKTFVSIYDLVDKVLNKAVLRAFKRVEIRLKALSRKNKKTRTNYVGSLAHAEQIALSQARRVVNDPALLRKLPKTKGVVAKKRREIIRDVRGYFKSIRSLHKGLERLKLGSIKVDYQINGTVVRSGSVGRKVTGKIHELAKFEVISKYTILTGTAYSFRGYRFNTDRDNTQGKGIAGVVARARL